MSESVRLLVAEDNPDDAFLLLQALNRAGIKFDHAVVDNEADYVAQLDPAIDLVISDYEMRGFGGMRALELLQERYPDVPFIIVSGMIGEQNAVEAMKRGAVDYLIKDRLGRLGHAVTHAIEQGRLRKERKCAEAWAHEQAAMLDLARDAIVMRSYRDRIITFWNKGAEHIYGWTSAEAVGRTIDDLIFLKPERISEVNAELEKSDEWTGENHHIAKGGRKLTVRSHATLVRDANGEPQSVLVINSDITEQKELEARFLRAQRMESIGTLASGVAHDLNNILSPIMMAIPLLRRDLGPAVREELISTIELSAARGSQVVKQVLTFGRGLEGERRPMQLASVIKEFVKIAAETFPRDISLSTVLPHDLWPVIGDATQLHQVALNLCVNARDAMPAGGRLEVRASNVMLDESYASMLPGATLGPNVLLEVEDTGQGMTAEVQERIFEPFFTTKSLGQGTGLGLSTVLGIVKSHGGHISVRSEVGAGTRFQIHLPAVQESAVAERAATTPEIPRARGECVLVVDDEEQVRRAAGIALETYGYKVMQAGDGAEALAVFAQNRDRVALVLTDLMMPYMDGVTLIHAIRRLKPTVAVIASTGLGRKRQLAELKEMKIQGLLHKPYGAAALLTTVHCALTGETSEFSI